jgi:riboflavin kinase/FMN adenylyltransferase
MQVSHGFDAFDAPVGGTALSIGNFDGVHRGHARIFEILREAARPARLTTLAVTLDPHPLAVLSPERAPALLTTIDEKLRLIERCGADACLVLRSEPILLGLAAGDFLARLVERCRPRVIVEGPDFNFGRARGGSLETLRANAGRYGYAVHVLPTQHCDELTSGPRISSSSIRQALVDGRLDDANAMLGRPYRIAGRVVGGDQRGRTIGFPTANLAGIPHLLPQEAVYAAVAQSDDDALHLAAVNIGPQPTFGGQVSRVEAHLLDHHGELSGRPLALHLLERLRPQMRFAGVAALVAQLHRDVDAVRCHRDTIRELKPIALPRWTGH